MHQLNFIIMPQIISYGDKASGREIKVLCFDKQEFEHLRQIGEQIYAQKEQQRKKKFYRFLAFVFSGVVILGIAVWLIVLF